jgi:hypothetical protein
MKSLRLSLERIQNIRFGRRGEAVIEATDQFGIQTYLTINCHDIPKVVVPLLRCAAINSKAPPSEPQRDAIIPDSHLPVVHWRMGEPTVDGEPILILTLAGGATLAFRFPPHAAQQCGRALAQTGMDPKSALDPLSPN